MRLLTLCCWLMLSSTSLATEERTVRAEILAMDARFFAAFNACDIETMGSIFSPSLEFYHDMSGLSGYDATMQVTRGNCERKLGLRRTLVEESTEVHALGEFGALQTGRHTFCHEVDGADDCGTFDFVHVWKREADGWRIHRVISYGH